MRAVLALSLLIGFYLLMLAVVVTDVAFLVVFVMLPPSNNGDQARLLGIPTNAMTSIAFSAPMLAAIFYGVFTVSWPNAPMVGSVLLSRRQAAELWETVEELAEQVGTRPPTQIRLIGEVNAMVSEESFLLGLVPGRTRLLYIGAPLLVGLRADELRAVLSHELGHYARKHTRLAAIVYRGSAAVNATLERLFESAGGGRRRFVGNYSGIVYSLLSRYAKLYHRIAFAVNRRQELEADAAAARIVGSEVIAEALRAVHAIAVSWQTFDSQILAPMRRGGRLPDDPFSAYQTMLEDPHYRDEFARLRYEIPPEVARPLDSHPSLARRLHMLGGLPEQVVELDPRPALDLFLEYQDSFERVRSGLYRSNPKPIPWQDWLLLAAESRAIEPARALKRAEARLAKAAATSAASGTSTSTNTGRPLLAAVLGRLEAGQGLELARQLDEALGITTPDTDTDYPGRLLVALLSLVGQGLVEIGAATWHLSWTGASVLIPRDITADELLELLSTAAHNPLEVPRLRLHLASLGLDERAQIALGEKGAQPSSLKVKPLTDSDASRRRGMGAAAIVTLFGLFIVLAVVGSATASKRSQIATSLYGPQALQSPLPADTYNYNNPANLNAIIPSWTPPRITLPSTYPSYLLHLIPPINLLPTDFVSTITVHSGDTLSSIAQKCATTVANLQRANGMGSSTLIDAGQALKIPEPTILLPATCH